MSADALGSLCRQLISSHDNGYGGLKWVPVFHNEPFSTVLHDERFQPLTPFRCWIMNDIEDTNISLDS